MKINMVCCSAFGCSNRSAQGYKMYSVPIEERRRTIWLLKIKRTGKLPVRPRLCEVHFEPSQFEPRIPGKLKHDAVPSLFAYSTNPKPKHRKLPLKRQQFESSEMEKIDISCDKGLPPTCDEDLPPSCEEDLPPSCEEDLPPVCEEDLPHLYGKDISPSCEIYLQPSCQKNLPPSCDKDLPPMDDDVESLKRTIDLLRKQLLKSEWEKDILEKKYSQLFTRDQVQFLKTRETTWSDETIKKALQLRFTCGLNGYKMLLSQNFPFPSDKTLMCLF